MAQNNDSPGKRLKREETKNTLYVNNPNDPRLQAYQDSLALHSASEKEIKGYRNALNQPGAIHFLDENSKKDKLEFIRKHPDMLTGSGRFTSKKLFSSKIAPEKEVLFGNELVPLYAKPKRPVVFRPEEPIEPLAPRQATLAPQEIIAPVPRPVDVPPAPAMKEPVMEEQVVTERPVARKPPKAVMPRRGGGWGNQPLLMQLFPKLYER